ncbi:DUF6265 family protein [Sphingomicrobium lutaoense]|uniref:DUF6265 domain-containing protein n=1 Tax=Sphingomicrobium lutaoense TaxID=515949 RepID=A0A839Z414_9SPHN|nr:DUF6265 family protein [Sphingomicrobium lutaoense]MBB3764325.1 hypothetical protein [Sphingomicrobium lutaoense]
MLAPILALFLFAAHPGHDGGLEEVPTQTALEHAAWMEGRWVGTGMGGDVEEVWSPAQGGQMVGHLTYARDGKVIFYELMLLRPSEGALEMLVKHFDGDFTAWEEKDEWIRFAPETTDPGVLLFKGLTIFHDAGRMDATVRMKQADGSVKDVLFQLERAE